MGMSIGERDVPFGLQTERAKGVTRQRRNAKTPLRVSFAREGNLNASCIRARTFGLGGMRRGPGARKRGKDQRERKSCSVASRFEDPPRHQPREWRRVRRSLSRGPEHREGSANAVLG